MSYLYKKLIIVFTIMMLTSCSTDEAPETKLVRPILSQKVVYSGAQQERTFSGSSRTDQIVKLSFRNSGVLSVLNIKLGQTVKKGQLLGQLDNVQARLNYENSISSKNSAESAMKTAKLNLNRIRALYEKGGSSLSDFEVAKDTYKNAQQSFNSAVRNVDIQKEQLGYGFLYAPTDGIIANVEAEANENINAGQMIATLNAGTQMDIALGVPESVINRINIEMSVEVAFTALPGQSFEGVVTEISPSIDTNTATYPIVVKLSEPSAEIKSGMAANVTFRFGNNSNQQNNAQMLIIPANAVGEDATGRFVFVVNQKGDQAFVKKQPITIGNLTAEGFEVTSGLKFGDYIATAGLQTLLDGQEVLFKQESLP